MFVLNRFLGHYRALEWSEAQQKYAENPELGIIVEVTVRRQIHSLTTEHVSPFGCL